jgi:predicted nucleotidyltransferase
MKETYDLRELTGGLTKAFPEIEALYLFGSRRYRTGSLRSDVDILVELREASHIRPRNCARSLRSTAAHWIFSWLREGKR